MLRGQVSFEEESQNPPAVGHWKSLMPSKGEKEEPESGCQDAGGVHEPQSTEQLNVSRLRSSSVEIREKGSEFLRDELHKAQKELKLKDKECERLSKVREQLEQELEELTASLFEEAHKMVREANTKQAAAEKQLREARGKEMCSERPPQDLQAPDHAGGFWELLLHFPFLQGQDHSSVQLLHLHPLYPARPGEAGCGADVLGGHAAPEGDVSGQTWILSQRDVSRALSVEETAPGGRAWSAVPVLLPPTFPLPGERSKRHKFHFQLSHLAKCDWNTAAMLPLELGWPWLLQDGHPWTLESPICSVYPFFKNLLFLYAACFGITRGQACAGWEFWTFLVSQSVRTDAGCLFH